jgi:hypothetical protein
MSATVCTRASLVASVPIPPGLRAPPPALAPAGLAAESGEPLRLSGGVATGCADALVPMSRRRVGTRTTGFTTTRT